MPELPEVETVRSGLERAFAKGATVRSVKVMRPDIRFPIPKDLAKKLTHQKITGVRRRAKYLLFDTPAGILLNHLGMTGTWRELGPEGKDKHDHLYIELEDGRIFAFRDPRRFGMIDWIEKGKESEHPRLKTLGHEPLNENEWSAIDLFNRSRKRVAPVKVFIMDQRILVGVGNIYASEALFRAGVKPTKAAGKVSLREWENITHSIREILRESIDAGGSTISDFKAASGSEGHFQDRFQVYDRDGRPCVKCKSKLKSKVIGGRSTYWCARCQR